MTSIGYALSSEEHAPEDMVEHAVMAEQAGFEFAMISDHYHPWIERHPHSPFVWSVLGALAQATDGIGLGTGVTCPMTGWSGWRPTRCRSAALRKTRSFT